MVIKFVAKISSQGDRCVIQIPKSKLKDVKNLNGLDLKVTLEEI